VHIFFYLLKALSGKCFNKSVKNSFQKDLAGRKPRLSLHPADKKSGCSLKAATVNGERKSEILK